MSPICRALSLFGFALWGGVGVYIDKCIIASSSGLSLVSQTENKKMPNDLHFTGVK